MEQRFFSCPELRAAIDEAAQHYRLEGLAVPWNRTATLAWGETERILPNAFGDLADADVILTVGHVPGNRESRAIARTDGGGLQLRNGPHGLYASATLPNTQLAAEAVANVSARILRGLSVEFFPKETRRAADGATEVVRARLTGLAIVAKPAYEAAEVVAQKRAAYEARGIGNRREVKPGGQVWFL